MDSMEIFLAGFLHLPSRIIGDDEAHSDVIVKFGEVGTFFGKRREMASASKVFETKFKENGDVEFGQFVAKNPSAVDYEGKRDFDVSIEKAENDGKPIVTIKGVTKAKAAKLFIKFTQLSKCKESDVIDMTPVDIFGFVPNFRSFEPDDVFELIELLRAFKANDHIGRIFTKAFDEALKFAFAVDSVAFRRLEAITRKDINGHDFKIVHRFAFLFFSPEVNYELEEELMEFLSAITMARLRRQRH